MRRGGLRKPIVEEERHPRQRLPFRVVTDQIEELRKVERDIQSGQEYLDRLGNALMSVHPGNLMVVAPFPHMTWAVLPDNWRTSAQWQVVLRGPPIPRDIKGTVGVSVSLAEMMVNSWSVGNAE